MLVKTILAEAKHGNAFLAEAIAAESGPVENILAAAVAGRGDPLS